MTIRKHAQLTKTQPFNLAWMGLGTCTHENIFIETVAFVAQLQCTGGLPLTSQFRYVSELFCAASTNRGLWSRPRARPQFRDVFSLISCAHQLLAGSISYCQEDFVVSWTLPCRISFWATLWQVAFEWDLVFPQLHAVRCF